jgi:hypothetical protein
MPNPKITIRHFCIAVSRGAPRVTQCSIAVVGVLGGVAVAANFGDISASMNNLLSSDAMSRCVSNSNQGCG